MSIPEALYEPLLYLKSIISRQNEVFIQLTLAEMIDSGAFERHFRRLRKIIKNRRDFMAAKLATIPGIGFIVPSVGLAFWLHTKELTQNIIDNAQNHKISVESENFYLLKKTSKVPQFIRLGFAKYDEKELTMLLNKLFA